MNLQCLWRWREDLTGQVMIIFLKKKKAHTHTYIAMNTISEEDEIRRNHIHGNTL